MLQSCRRAQETIFKSEIRNPQSEMRNGFQSVSTSHTSERANHIRAADANQHAWWCEFILFCAGKNCLCVWSMESFGRLVAYRCLGQRGMGCGGCTNQ